MAGEVIAPVPAAGSPKVAAPVVPTPAPKAAETSPELLAERAKFAEYQKAQELKMVRAQRKYADTDSANKKTWGEKLSRLDALEKERAAAKLNKSAYAESVWGKDWYDQLVAEKINGGAPTADVVASEIARLEEKFEAKLSAKETERAEAAAKAATEAAKQREAEARKSLVGHANSMWAAKGDKFPEVSALGTADEIASELARRVEQHYLATAKRDEDGHLLQEGEVLSLQKVAELWEGSLVEFHKKREERLKPKPKDVGQPLRRTLTNDLGGSTPTRVSPAATEAERLERSLAARQKYLDEKAR